MKRLFRLLVDFFKLWFFMFFTYMAAKITLNIVLYGWIDLRRLAILEALTLPIGQGILFWTITRAWKKI